jgi:HSP20 family molecular chaperone IbpA
VFDVEVNEGENLVYATSATTPTKVIMLDGVTNAITNIPLPAVKRENISVTFDNNVLTIAGERKAEEGIGQRYHRNERSYGQFLRSFTLPPFVDTKNITAESKEGMLLVTLPKVEEAKAKQIEVKVE